MKTRILAFTLALPLATQAAPFVVGDVVPEADTCVYTLDGGAEQSTPVVAGPPRICKVDIGTVTQGAHTIRVKVRNAVWGSASDSPFASLDFARPAALGAPGSIRLTP